MPTPIFTGKINYYSTYQGLPVGTFVPDSQQAYENYLSSLKDKRVEVIIRKERSERSLNQNSYYWGVVVQLIADHTGYEPEEAHEALKVKFLSDPKADKHGLLRIRSTTKLSTVEFNDYLNRVVRWAAQELGVYIPDPSHVEGG